MDHDLGEFKLLVPFFADVLSDHRRCFTIRSHTISVSIHHMTILIVVIKRTESRRLADPTVT